MSPYHERRGTSVETIERHVDANLHGSKQCGARSPRTARYTLNEFDSEHWIREQNSSAVGKRSGPQSCGPTRELSDAYGFAESSGFQPSESHKLDCGVCYRIRSHQKQRKRLVTAHVGKWEFLTHVVQAGAIHTENEHTEEESDPQYPIPVSGRSVSWGDDSVYEIQEDFSDDDDGMDLEYFGAAPGLFTDSNRLNSETTPRIRGLLNVKDQLPPTVNTRRYLAQKFSDWLNRSLSVDITGLIATILKVAAKTNTIQVLDQALDLPHMWPTQTPTSMERHSRTRQYDQHSNAFVRNPRAEMLENYSGPDEDAIFIPPYATLHSNTRARRHIPFELLSEVSEGSERVSQSSEIVGEVFQHEGLEKRNVWEGHEWPRDSGRWTSYAYSESNMKSTASCYGGRWTSYDYSDLTVQNTASYFSTDNDFENQGKRHQQFIKANCKGIAGTEVQRRTTHWNDTNTSDDDEDLNIFYFVDPDAWIRLNVESTPCAIQHTIKYHRDYLVESDTDPSLNSDSGWSMEMAHEGSGGSSLMDGRDDYGDSMHTYMNGASSVAHRDDLGDSTHSYLKGEAQMVEDQETPALQDQRSGKEAKVPEIHERATHIQNTVERVASYQYFTHEDNSEFKTSSYEALAVHKYSYEDPDGSQTVCKLSPPPDYYRAGKSNGPYQGAGGRLFHSQAPLSYIEIDEEAFIKYKKNDQHSITTLKSFNPKTQNMFDITAQIMQTYKDPYVTEPYYRPQEQHDSRRSSKSNRERLKDLYLTESLYRRQERYESRRSSKANREGLKEPDLTVPYYRPRRSSKANREGLEDPNLTEPYYRLAVHRELNVKDKMTQVKQSHFIDHRSNMTSAAHLKLIAKHLFQIFQMLQLELLPGNCSCHFTNPQSVLRSPRRNLAHSNVTNQLGTALPSDYSLRDVFGGESIHAALSDMSQGEDREVLQQSWNFYKTAVPLAIVRPGTAVLLIFNTDGKEQFMEDEAEIAAVMHISLPVNQLKLRRNNNSEGFEDPEEVVKRMARFSCETTTAVEDTHDDTRLIAQDATYLSDPKNTMKVECEPFEFRSDGVNRAGAHCANSDQLDPTRKQAQGSVHQWTVYIDSLGLTSNELMMENNIPMFDLDYEKLRSKHWFEAILDISTPSEPAER
ncbi:hypothetical protein BJ742DRAFT_735457 [Cladochytrium replicatum]|nr:hypothetical protein BJ742DRAFT_735457 [Cladochytrium replicatum]